MVRPVLSIASIVLTCSVQIATLSSLISTCLSSMSRE
ncbi:hypothetical protein EVA_13186 [gut metagenome]|uniref:Uncharacterized protein n=1 Tax=gut metagenome TaxID=749906 RepID=J9FUQ0_9ZZZZ